MTTPISPYRLLSVDDIPNFEGLSSEAELVALAGLKAAGFALAPLKIVLPEVEEMFYRLNNLPEKLKRLFKDVNPDDPDEDDIEDLSPQALKLVKSHYLLDEFIDLFYEAITDLPEKLCLRRPALKPSHIALRGRPALLALKDIWAQDWSFDALMSRLKTWGLAPEMRPVLIQAIAQERAEVELEVRASAILEQAVGLELDASGNITRVILESADKR